MAATEPTNDKTPDWPECACLAARCEKEGRLDEAIRWYQRSIELNPWEPGTPAAASGDAAAIARCLIRLGRGKDALARYEEAVNYDEGNIKAWSGKAALEEELGMRRELIETLRRAIQAMDRRAEHFRIFPDAVREYRGNRARFEAHLRRA